MLNEDNDIRSVSSEFLDWCIMIAYEYGIVLFLILCFSLIVKPADPLDFDDSHMHFDLAASNN